jgi:hypothetical protein
MVMEEVVLEDKFILFQSNIIMKANFIIALFLISQFVVAQKIEPVDDSVKYIQDYYSGFSTGYDFDGKYITFSDNYKATFSDAIFTLTSDSIDEKKNLQKQTITINLKDVLSMKPNGTDVVEIFGNDPFILPICGKLAFKTATEEYNLNIYYEVDDDVEKTKIYKAFQELIKTKQ